MTRFNHIAILGLGLIGGGLAKLIRETYPQQELLGVSRNLEALKKAKEEGVLSSYINNEDPLPRTVDLIFVCTPISYTVACIKELANKIEHPVTITDVASVKEEICSNLQDLPDHITFIGGHPMAGIEKTGYDYSSSKMMKKATYILTGKNTDSLNKLSDFLSSCNFNMLHLSPDQHDRLVAAASHFPYLMAGLTTHAISSLVNEEEKEMLKSIISSGFRDTTRVASSDPEWGQDICETNKENLLEALSGLKTHIESLETMIQQGDGQKLHTLFSSLKEIRDQLYISTRE